MRTTEPRLTTSQIALGAVTLALFVSACGGETLENEQADRQADQPTNASADQQAEEQESEPMTHTSQDTGAPPQHTNRLANETSPYLLQHAHNPVDWFPWGDEAIQKAREEDKLIFLSVGYSTCYWCHVMERESFESEEIAALMNEHFINIKVDREERPDVDDIYMHAVQLMTGRGGWPMSVWLDPETLRPVYGGTYFPPEPRSGMTSFPQLIEAISRAWTEERDAIMESAARVADAVEQNLAAERAPVVANQDTSRAAVDTLLSVYDPIDGGFGTAPKFPHPPYLDLLLGTRQWLDAGTQQRVDESLQHTLDRMAMGGMYDQIGGGFHRYSTDGQWLVPHFEKMLYDNGQLASIYARAHELYQDDYYAEIVRETVNYVLREMRDDGGAFWSAQDAEVNAREGQNYLWTPEEVRSVLEAADLADDVDFALNVYGLDQGTNFQDPHHPDEPPSNVIHLPKRREDLAAEHELTIEALNERIARINQALLTVRDTRDQPRTDDKVIASWNGLMIGGLADAGRILNEPAFIDAAIEAAEFILSDMRAEDGGLLRIYRDGTAKVDAFLEDYSLMMHGLIALYRATDNITWLDRAIELLALADARFADNDSGGYFDTLADQPDLFVRTRTTYDGAVPSGNSVMLLNLLDLYELTKEDRFLTAAASTLASLSSEVVQNPAGTSLATLGLMRIAMNHPDHLPLGGGGERPSASQPVVVSANRASVRVTEAGSDILLLRVETGPGYHINAHEPGDATLVGFLVSITGGEGVVVQPDYPLGELYRDEIRIHQGAFIIPVRFEKIGEVSGRPRVQVRWQTCTDRECLEPQSKILDVELKVE